MVSVAGTVGRQGLYMLERRSMERLYVNEIRFLLVLSLGSADKSLV